MKRADKKEQPKVSSKVDIKRWKARMLKAINAMKDDEAKKKAAAERVLKVRG